MKFFFSCRGCRQTHIVAHRDPSDRSPQCPSCVGGMPTVSVLYTGPGARAALLVPTKPRKNQRGHTASFYAGSHP